MSDERHLDGNALGGVFFELFGREMTAQPGCCGNCGAVNPLGAVHVYRDAPGDVMRCPACGSVLLVMVAMETGYRVGFDNIRWIETA